MGKKRDYARIIDPSLCPCKHYEASHCLAMRHEVALTMVQVLAATCQCGCHRNGNGTYVPSGVWKEKRAIRDTDRVLPESDVKNLLSRFVRYYNSRMKSPDVEIWVAKKNTVLRLAENLDIRIEERVDDATTAKEASGRRD